MLNLDIEGPAFKLLGVPMLLNDDSGPRDAWLWERDGTANEARLAPLSLISARIEDLLSLLLAEGAKLTSLR